MEEEEEVGVNGCGRRGSEWGHIALLDKTKEFFQTCDVEGKGFITRTDMRRLHRELPLSAEELQDVFDSLDTDRAGYLTLEAFSSRFGQFLHGRRISVTDDQTQAPGPVLKAKEALYQSQWEARLSGVEDEEERHFCMLLESLGASNVFEDPGEVRNLWAQLRRDEPHLLSNFEEFLARVTYQIKEAHQEKKEMESALQRKTATHDSEIRHLYEEMEAQIKNEKDRLVLQDSERLQVRSQELEHQLFSKERELEQLFQKQKRLELQCHELNSERQESHVENVKLKTTNEELSRALESTSLELSLAQEHLALLQEQAARLHQEKEMEMYRITEGLQREKQCLMKQLDLLREVNKHLKDERDIFCAVPRTSLRKKQKQMEGLADLFDDESQPAKRDPLLVEGSFQSLEALPIKHLQIVFVASSSCSEDDDAPAASTARTAARRQRPAAKKASTLANGIVSPGPAREQDVKPKPRRTSAENAADRKVVAKTRESSNRGESERKTSEEEVDVLGEPTDGWPLRRVISIEEDHLPHLLQGGPQPLLHQLREEEDDYEEEAHSEAETSAVTSPDLSATPLSRLATVPTGSSSTKKSQVKKTPVSPRCQPVGREAKPVSLLLQFVSNESLRVLVCATNTTHFSHPQKAKESAVFAPDRLFKVVLVGNSSVGKTSLLRSFCEGRFHPSTTATVGIDYSVKTLTLDNMQIAMQLWDTAGQERFRSMTKQFFRKADGVVLLYDVTVAESFAAVKPWLLNVQEAAGESIPILLLGNKMDMTREREVSFKDAEQLASENKVMFFEVSAYTGKNVTESLTHLARILMEQEDTVRDTTVSLSAQPIKKKACCK
ncbi:PREDICTED: ras and EF-hand domain-containing protein-like isoform X2 [Poecilia mexicana]|uniref:ras and EF-hand domain-containing protein-like isoform X2 n=1 Tax=Poecilia mexicana TaxID=48701 RepID=UPI00072DF23A|nr:PREDICTED: ras and EF-hand domain-containing protein-like isoform X2 [Poecilia mexicana]